MTICRVEKYQRQRHNEVGEGFPLDKEFNKYILADRWRGIDGVFQTDPTAKYSWLSWDSPLLDWRGRFMANFFKPIQSRKKDSMIVSQKVFAGAGL